MTDPNIRHITSGWHVLPVNLSIDHGGQPHDPMGPMAMPRVCEHWVEIDAPIIEGEDGPVAPMVPLQLPDGTTRHGQAEVGLDGKPKPTRLRSYVGLVLEIGEVQVQARGRIRVGAGRLRIELEA